MQNEHHVIDFIDYRKQRYVEQNMQKKASTQDLSTEIRILIERLREHRPLKQTG